MAANARASASQLFSLKAERVSAVLPSSICARGKRSWSAFTQAGAKPESPFFQLPNHTRTMRWPIFLASSIAASTILKSYLPFSGSIQFHPTAIAAVFWCVSAMHLQHVTQVLEVGGRAGGRFRAQNEERLPVDDQLSGQAALLQMGNGRIRGLVCAYAAEIARAQTTAPPVRIEKVMRSLLFTTSSAPDPRTECRGRTCPRRPGRKAWGRRSFGSPGPTDAARR